MSARITVPAGAETVMSKIERGIAGIEEGLFVCMESRPAQD
jgi:hypothetical protein